MGFRSISDFNKAVLGKHCWRLTQYKEPLSNGQNFPKSQLSERGSFMEVKQGFASSYAWSSMMIAREVVKKGSRWLVRNRKEVKVWKDNWMLANSESKVMSPITTLSLGASVCELNDSDTKQWRRDLIRMSFSQEEAQQIISIRSQCVRAK